MEGRGRRYGGQTSPQSAPPWAELIPQNNLPPPPPLERKIPVVYYLCRNRHLEHPHFIEVPLSSPEGLFLRDVINRLNVLRGKGMPAMYSWSCKRSYKNGFVWHDLADDDLVLPANANEYVLKGSELLDRSPSDRIQQGNGNPMLAISKPQRQENTTFSRTQQVTSSSSSPSSLLASSVAVKELKSPPSPPSPQDDDHSPLLYQRGIPANTSPDLGPLKPSSSVNHRICQEHRTCKTVEAADASTQTEDSGGRNSHGGRAVCTRGISTDESSLYVDFFDQKQHSSDLGSKDGSDTGAEEISPAATRSIVSSSSGKTETLESLIRAEGSRINSFRILEEEEVLFNTGPKLRPTGMLMQLITCGSISVKDHHQSFGLVPSYKPRFSHAKLLSPVFSRSMMYGELDYLSDDPRLIALRLEDKVYFSGSLIETKRRNRDMIGETMPTLKRSSSYNADRSCKTPDSKQINANLADASRSKCLPRSMRLASNKQSKNEAIKSSISDAPRKSSAGLHCGESSREEIRRITPSVDASSTGVDSSEEKTEKLIKIEETLISGARVTIQSRAACDEREDSDA